MSFRRRMMGSKRMNSVTFNLINITCPSPTYAEYDTAYTATLTPSQGCQILPQFVKVTMGNVDVTNSAYDFSTNTVNILSVNGNIEISAEAIELSDDYEAIEYCYIRTQHSSNVWQLSYPATHLTEIEIDCTGTGKGVLVGHSSFGSNGSGVLSTDFVFRPRYTAANSGYASKWGSSSYNTSKTTETPPSTRYIFKYGKAKVSFSTGHVHTFPEEEFTVEKNIHLFGYAGSNTSGNYIAKIYNVNHYEDGVLQHRYVPILRKSDKKIGIYEVLSKTTLTTFITQPNSIAPYVAVTRSLTNCTEAMTSSGYTGVEGGAVIGENWSCKYTPSANYTFNDTNAVFQVMLNGEDVTSTHATYDSLTDTWTINYTAQRNDTISVVATTEVVLTSTLDNVILSNSTANMNQSFTTTLSPDTSTYNDMQILPSMTRVIMNGNDVTTSVYDSVNETITIDVVTGKVQIIASAIQFDTNYVPLEYIGTKQKIGGTVASNGITLPSYPSSNTKLVLDLSVSSDTYSMIYNAKGINPNTTASESFPQFYFWSTYTTNNSYRVAWGSIVNGSSSLGARTLRKNKRILFTCDRGRFTYENYNGVMQDYSLDGGTWSRSSNNISIMAESRSAAGTASYNVDGKVFGCSVSEYNTTSEEYDLIVDYVPMKRVSDNKVGLYNLVDGSYIINSTNMPSDQYIAPYVSSTNTFTNCTATLLSNGTTGTITRAVIGSTWSIKLTPSSGCTLAFNPPTVSIGGVDVTSSVLTDNQDGTYTVTIVNVPKSSISITAQAVANLTSNLTNVTLSNTSPTPYQSYTATLTPDTDNTVLPSTIRVLMNNVDVTDTVYDFTNNTITINSVTGGLEITAEAAVIPQGYTPVKYIEVVDGAYINTGIKSTSNVKFNLDIYVPEYLSNYGYWLFGSRLSGSSQGLCFFTYRDGNTMHYQYGANAKSTTTYLSPGRYTLSNEANKNVLTINNLSTNTTSSITVASSTWTSNLDFYIFTMNNNGSPVNRMAGGRSKGCKIYSSDTLVRDYVPVSKDGEGYFYDKVSGEMFGNVNETGSFTYA